jgi:hypothetical protein
VVVRWGAKLSDMCWYSGFNWILLGVKYVRLLCLWSVGWFLSKWLMGPGLISMSPPKSKNRRVETMEWGFVWDGIGKYFLFEVA